MSPHFAPSGLRAALAALLALAAAAAHADRDTLPVRAERGTLRAGASFDYAPFSEGSPQSPSGFDVALLEAYAADRGVELAWKRFRWPELLRGLESARFDLAVSGITVRPERSAAGRFTIALAETGALLLARTPERWGGSASFDRPRVRIGVNAGGHLERVARARFPRATLLVIPDNDAVIRALAEGAVDAVVTDTVEAPHWKERVEDEVAAFGPLTRDRKAWIVRADAAALAADLDAWLLAREADGTLARLREEHLGQPGPATARPLAALLAAVDERLSLMPLVGHVKRREGEPLEVPEREEEVLDAALADLLAAAEAAEREPPPEAAVRDFFRAQMEAAKQVQWSAVKDRGHAPEPPYPDLDEALRPALLRIGARIARLLLELPPGLDAETVRAAAADALRAPYLTDASREAIVRAVAACAAEPAAEEEPADDAGGPSPPDADPEEEPAPEETPAADSSLHSRSSSTISATASRAA